MGLGAGVVTALGFLFEALANKAAALQKAQFLLPCLVAASLLFLYQQHAGGSYLRGIFRFLGSRLRERGHRTIRKNHCESRGHN
jgi:hypothetical protein